MSETLNYLDVNDRIKKETKAFLKYCIMLLLDSDDLTDSYVNGDFSLEGVTGCADLVVMLNEYNTIEDEEQRYYEKNIIEEKLEKTLDISVCRAVITNSLKKLEKRIKEENEEYNREKNICASVLQSLDDNKDIFDNDLDLDERTNLEYKLTNKLKSVGIEPIVYSFEEPDEESENTMMGLEKMPEEDLPRSIWDVDKTRDAIDDFLSAVEKKIQNSKKQFSKEAFDATAEDLKELEEELNKNINDPRRKDAHDRMDDNQMPYEVRERAKKYLEHIDSWRPLFAKMGKLGEYDHFKSNALDLYKKFDNNIGIVIYLGGKECHTVEGLIEAITLNWDQGVDLLKANASIPELIKQESELLMPTYNILSGVVQDIVSRETAYRIDEVVKAKERRLSIKKNSVAVFNDYKTWYDACLFKFIYGMMPKYEYFCWGDSIRERKAVFVKKFFEPMFQLNDMSGAKNWLISRRLDQMAEYGLFSYLFQMINKTQISSRQQYDIAFVNRVERDILAFTSDEDEKDQVPLFYLYNDMMRLGSWFGYEYLYPIRLTKRLSKDENKRYVKVNSINKLHDYFYQKLEEGDIDTVFNLIVNNSFSSLRAWLMWKLDDSNAVKEYFEWYHTVRFFVKHISHLDKEFIKKIGSYVEFVDILHKNMHPLTKLEYKCMVCYRFFKMLSSGAEEFDFDSEVELIRTYYCQENPRQDHYLDVQGAECADIIPYNSFGLIKPIIDDTVSIEKYGIHEVLAFRSVLKKYLFDDFKGFDIRDIQMNGGRISRDKIKQFVDVSVRIRTNLSIPIEANDYPGYGIGDYIEAKEEEFDELKKECVNTSAGKINLVRSDIENYYNSECPSGLMGVFKYFSAGKYIDDADYLYGEAIRMAESPYDNSLFDVANDILRLRERIRSDQSGRIGSMVLMGIVAVVIIVVGLVLLF